LLAAASSEDEATVLAEAGAQQVAVAGESASGSDLLALITEVVALDLDVVAAQRVAGNGSGDLEQEQRAKLRLEDQITRRCSRSFLVE
jgi:predicted ABC-type transport system involved in lysophospholipase L1 biosynthesis ATPase subunit